MLLRRSLLAVSVPAIAFSLSAQSRSTTAVVNPAGVFYQRMAGPAMPSSGNDSVQGLRWTYPDANWITEKVSVGDHGSTAWLGQHVNNERYSVLSTTDYQPPAPLMEMQRLGSDWLYVKAADKGPFAVTSTVTSGASVVEFWSYSSPTPIWTLSIGQSCLVDISETGQIVAVGYSPTTTTAQIDVYDAFAGPAAPIAVLTASTHGLRQFDLSDDGSTVLMATHTDNHLFDVATGQQIFQDGSTVSHDAHAIDRDGSAWGRGGFNPVRAWVRSGNTYNQVLNFNDTTLGFAVFTAAGISNDGSTFAAAAYDAQNGSFLRVYCWSLSPTSSTLLWSYASNGTGTLQTTPQAVSISDDGSVIAVGSWGDSNNTHPEVLLFARNGNGTPLSSLDTPGSCFDLDLSGDGRFLVVGTKAVHANSFGRGGEGYSFDLGGLDFRLDGAVATGRTVSLSTEGAPGELVILGFAGGLGAPTTILGIGGTLELDLSRFFTNFVAGTIPASGPLVFPFAIPAIPSLAGHEFAVQAAHGAPFSFTNALRLPIAP
ncbi:MAG: hypothetical protein Fur0037_06230 [Planctomycetota bacterium]